MSTKRSTKKSTKSTKSEVEKVQSSTESDVEKVKVPIKSDVKKVNKPIESDEEIFPEPIKTAEEMKIDIINRKVLEELKAITKKDTIIPIAGYVTSKGSDNGKMSLLIHEDILEGLVKVERLLNIEMINEYKDKSYVRFGFLNTFDKAKIYSLTDFFDAMTKNITKANEFNTLKFEKGTYIYCYVKFTIKGDNTYLNIAGKRENKLMVYIKGIPQKEPDYTSQLDGLLD